MTGDELVDGASGPSSGDCRDGDCGCVGGCVGCCDGPWDCATDPPSGAGAGAPIIDAAGDEPARSPGGEDGEGDLASPLPGCCLALGACGDDGVGEASLAWTHWLFGTIDRSSSLRSTELLPSLSKKRKRLSMSLSRILYALVMTPLEA